MTIQAGDPLPAAAFGYVTKDGHANGDTVLFQDKRCILFGVPGAFTPTCSHQHLPEFVAKASDIKNKGIDLIGCVSVNDAFVMEAWGKAHNALDQVMMIADGNAELTQACGLSLDASKFGMGAARSVRYAMLVDKGLVDFIGIEENPAQVTVSGAAHVLERL